MGIIVVGQIGRGPEEHAFAALVVFPVSSGFFVGFLVHLLLGTLVSDAGKIAGEEAVSFLGSWTFLRAYFASHFISE